MNERERDESTSEDVQATHPTDEDDEKKDDKDAAVDEASEQSMDGSDAPSW